MKLFNNRFLFLALMICLLIMPLSRLTACDSGGNSKIDFTGVDHSDRPTSDPGDASDTPETAQPPSGNIDPKLIGMWNNGYSTLEIRRILTGKYDIRAISNFREARSGVSYTFFEDGTYINIIKAANTVLVIEGNYSVSNNTITFTNRVGRSTGQSDVPIVWDKTIYPDDETHSFEFGVSEIWGHDILYFDGETEEAGGYSRFDDDV